MGYRRLDHDSIVAAYLAGRPLRFIRCDRKTVFNVLRERGIAPNRTGDRSWLDEARTLRAQGLSYERIGEAVGASSTTVMKALREPAHA